MSGSICVICPQQVHNEQIPEVSGFFKKYVNLDPQKELCPVCPSQHYHMGGLPTTESGQVLNGSQKPIPGLFAVGECAAASLHGFNRLGTNSILELITMGKFASEKILADLNGSSKTQPDAEGGRVFSQFSAYLDAGGKDNVGRIRESLRALMTARVGVFRTEAGISEAIETLKELKARADHTALSSRNLTMNQELTQRWELDNLLSVSMVIARAALYRKESRGAHFREDYPAREDAFNHHSLTFMPEFGQVEIQRRSVDMSLFEAGGRNHEKFGLIERKY